MSTCGIYFPCIWIVDKSHTAPRSHSQTLLSQMLSPGLSHGSVYDSIRRDTTGAGEKSLGKKYPRPKMLEYQTDRVQDSL